LTQPAGFPGITQAPVGAGAGAQAPLTQVCPSGQQTVPQIRSGGQGGVVVPQGAMQRGFSFGGSVQQPLLGVSQK
jgi:hypothetical protein